MLTPMDLIKQKKAQAINKIMEKGYFASKRIYVGMATCEIAAGSTDVMDVFKKAIDNGLSDVYLSQKGCSGRCNLEPTIEIIEENQIPVKYGKVTAQMAQTIIDRHIKNGEVITEWVIE